MSNVSIITDTARDSNLRTVQDYSAGVYAHLSSDYLGHAEVAIHAQPYVETVGGDLVSGSTLRMLLTDTAAGDVAVAVAIPVSATGTQVSTIVPPIITRQPTAANRQIGDAFQFIVSAITDSPITYQWQKNNVSLAGANSQRLVFPSLVIANTGAYRAVIVNSNGTSISSTAQLTVTRATSRPRLTLSNLETLPAVR